MNRIDQAFAKLKSEGRKGLAPFICGGYPTPESTEKSLIALDRAGATLAEIGIPFSDPIADGPVIAAAMHEALQTGVTPADVLASVARARKSTELPVVLMVSVSIVWKLGVAQLAAAAAQAGVDGFILPDVPVEESTDLVGPIREKGLTASLLVAPTTPPERMEQIVKASSGFVYLLARVGVTGDAQSGGPSGAVISQRVRQLRGMTDLPIACGFGVSTPEHVAAVVGEGGADAAIVGSALVKRMGRAAAEGYEASTEAESFVRSLRVGLKVS